MPATESSADALESGVPSFVRILVALTRDLSLAIFLVPIPRDEPELSAICNVSSQEVR